MLPAARWIKRLEMRTLRSAKCHKITTVHILARCTGPGFWGHPQRDLRSFSQHSASTRMLLCEWQEQRPRRTSRDNLHVAAHYRECAGTPPDSPGGSLPTSSVDTQASPSGHACTRLRVLSDPSIDRDNCIQAPIKELLQ
jgi:hypothetical protein